jgi:hypothetical protein
VQRLLPFFLLFALCAQVRAKSNSQPKVSEPLIYTGICGGSAAAAVGQDLFIVADDESNQLRLYRRENGGNPLQTVDLSAGLELDRRAPETDIEGAARIGDRVYWISSHSRNTAGREHANRYRFFATRLEVTNGTVGVSIVGRPCRDLLSQLISAPGLKSLNLRAAARLAPKAPGALNIEGLCATADSQLLIGFRNPVPHGLALLVPLQNPAQVIAGQPAKFGMPIQLDLNGYGIRDMAYWEGSYLIIAGPYAGDGKSKLFLWSGGDAKPKHLREIDLKGLNPEALIVYPDKGLREVQLLSDDSNHQGQPCDAANPGARHFRSVWVTLDWKHLSKR